MNWPAPAPPPKVEPLIEPMTDAERAHLLAWLGGVSEFDVRHLVAKIGDSPQQLNGWRQFWALQPEHAPKV